MPWIRLQRADDGQVTVSGTHACRLGHRITLADGFTCGVYAGWQWDGRELLLDNDRYAFFPLFAWSTPDSCTIASDLTTLLDLGADRTIDRDAVAAFLRLGFFLDDDTPFAAIRAVPPRATLVWTSTGPQLCGVLSIPERLAISRAAAVDGFIDLFRAAIARRAPQGPFELPLSGGKDSRHILLELLRAGYRPSACITLKHFPPRSNIDVDIARALSDRVGVRHHVIPQRRDRTAAEREKNRRTHFCGEEGVQWLALADRLPTTSTETYDGIAGDVLSQSMHLSAGLLERFESGNAGSVTSFMLSTATICLPERGVRALVSPAVYGVMSEERARARIERAVHRHVNAPNPVGSFFLWNRTRREVALTPYGLLRDLVVYAPYLDRDLFDFLAGLPGAMLLDRTLHTDAIARAFPEYADVPYEKTARTEGHRSTQRRFALGLLRTLAARPRLLNTRALLPGVLATALDGHPMRLWHGARTVYLSQLSELATT
jgi:asparagine synthase (glutamine-hydrolysing)